MSDRTDIQPSPAMRLLNQVVLEHYDRPLARVLCRPRLRRADPQMIHDGVVDALAEYAAGPANVPPPPHGTVEA